MIKTTRRVSSDNDLDCLETYIQSKASSLKNKAVLDTLATFKQLEIKEFISFFIRCLIQTSNFDEIVNTVDYIEVLKLEIPEPAACDLLCLFLEYDNWVYFKKYFALYFQSIKVTDKTIKKLISLLVEKQNLELMRFVIGVTMKDYGAFMDMKLTENQYKFIILSLVKNQIDLSHKIAAIAQPVISPNISNTQSDTVTDTITESNFSQDGSSLNYGESVRNVDDSDSDGFEILNEEMIQKIIKEIAACERKK